MKIRARVLVLAGLLTLSAAPVAHASPDDLLPVIPFEFAAGGKTLPAGTYTVSRSAVYSGVLNIRNRQGGVFFLSPAEETGPADRSPRLVFHRYGGRYFLRSVWFAGRRGYELPASMDEREASTRTASRPEEREVVALQVSDLGS